MSSPQLPGVSSLKPRDFLLLPLVSLVTLTMLFAAGEALSRVFFAEQPIDACMVPDARLGLRYRPFCVSKTKNFESPWIINKYNDCGYRSDSSCAPTNAGTKRVVVMGSSVAQGFLVPQDQAFAQLAAKQLSGQCRSPVEFQNLAGFEIFWSRLIARVPDAIRLKPDAVLVQVAPFDLEQQDPGRGPSDTNFTGREPKQNLVVTLKEAFSRSRAMKVAQHFLLRNDSLYVPMYLKTGNKSAYMREPLTPFWQKQLSDYDNLLGHISDQFRPLGIPVILVFVPQRAQASIAAMRVAPPGVDAKLLSRILRASAERHGLGFIDVTDDFVRSGNIRDLFYPVDGHLDAAGHIIVARSISNGLVSTVGAFSQCHPDVSRPNQ